MTALPQDVVTDLEHAIAELEQRLESGLTERDEAIARLQAELRAVRDRQAGSAEILRAIADTSGDAELSLQQIAETTARLFGASSVTLRIASGDEWSRTINVGPSAKRIGLEVSAAQLRIGARNLPGTVVLENRQIHIPDINNVDPAIADWPGLPPARAAGTRVMSGTPLRREGKAIGALIVHRDRPEPFTEEELALQQSFADQAVIAIENARLFNETEEALERQTATADILKVIASSPSDVQPVFEAIVTNAARLIGGFSAGVYRFAGDGVHLAAFTPINPDADKALRASFPRPIAELEHFRVAQAGGVLQVTDTEDQHDLLRELARARGFRSLLHVPLTSHGTPIGVIAVSRKEPGSFTAHHVELLQTFADQAVIAIENVRLFNETKEALERQTATADILKVIASSPSDVQPVFEAIAESAKRLLGGQAATVTRAIDDMIHLAAFTAGSEAGNKQLQNSFPIPLSSPGIHSTVARTGELALRTDLETDPNLPPGVRELARARGTRSIIVVPMLRDGVSIGTIGVARREPGPFTGNHIDLLKTFADQAVIAIENVRLFNETKQALERQTATADILKVIASSPSDVQPVFDAIATSANRLIGGLSTAVHSLVDDTLHLTAFTPTSPAGDAALQASFPRPLSALPWGEQMRNGELVHIPDVKVEGAMLPDLRDLARMRGFRSMLRVPLLRDRAPIGFISVTRVEPGMFAAHHVQLLQTFADQAVIAIENTRLFNETQEALRRQTATAEILKVIASSPSDVQPVFDVIVERAVRLCGGRMGRVYRYDGAVIQMVAGHGLSAPGLGKVQQVFPRPATDDTIAGQVMLSHRPRFVTDIQHDDSVPPLSRQMIEALGTRSQVTVPMLRTGEAIGAITVGWAEPGAFGDQQVSLLQTFADQAVIAIENVRLFNETEEALERQTATADILKVIASSPSDVQPVFEAIAERANRLVDGLSTAVFSLVDDTQHLMAFTRKDPEADATLQALFPRPLSAFAWGEQIRNGEIFHISDTEVELSAQPSLLELARTRGFRSFLLVPLLRDRTPIGLISITRAQPGTFVAHHVQLLQTFADQAVIAIENVRLFNETKEALERQTATADILKVIASSPSDVQPVFEAIAASAKRLIGGFSAAVFRFVDDVGHLAAFTPTRPAADEVWKASFPRRLSDFPPFEWVRGGEAAQIPDIEASPDVRDLGRLRGFRSVLVTPLMSSGVVIGMVSVTRLEPGSFAAHHVQLLQTFADQAVIAIENTRLFNETKEALERQTATADILKVIASSPSDVQPVFEAIATSANRLIGGFSSTVFRFVDGIAYLKAFTPTTPAADEVLKTTFPQPVADFAPFRMAQAGEVSQIPDTEASTYELQNISRARGYRSMLFAPLMNDGVSIGFIAVTRVQPGTFADHHVQLLRTFADQAVIAIENARLFEEVQTKTRDLTEALTYQTGSSNILSVIASSPTDVAPVLQAIVESACRLCEAYDAVVLLKDGDHLRFSAHHGPIPINIEKWPINRNWASGRAFVDQEPVHVRDLLSDEGADFPDGRELSQHTGTEVRSILSVPLLRENESVGAILLRRTEVHPFSDKQIALLQTFADQAVIAIGNVRLFDEVQAKTRDLTEALTYQTGSSNILRVIASSPTDVEPVLKAIVESACELCEAYDAIVRLKDGDDLRLGAHHGPIPTSIDRLPINRDGTAASRAFLDQKPVHVHDLLGTDGAQFPAAREMSRFEGGHRTILSVPLLREGESIGVIVLRRIEVHPFSDKQIALLQTFADQAVIAIGNVQLFDEVQAKTRDLSESLDQQTATSEVLEVISSSPGELAPVFQKMLENATRICGANFGTMNLYDGERFQNVALYNVPHVYAEQMLAPIDPHPKSGLASIARTHQAVQIEDLRTQPPYLEGDPAVLAMSDLAGARTIVIVPMLRENELVGTIAIYRQEVRPFTDKQIDLVANFAKQAVIAIENTRLLKELRQRTDDLGESLQQQTATADVLKVISASPGELEPVFQAMLDNAVRLCEAKFAMLFLYEENEFRAVGKWNLPPAYGEFLGKNPIIPDPKIPLGRVVMTKQPVQIADVLVDQSYIERFPGIVGVAELGGARTLLQVPMLKENELVGTIGIYRQEVRPFTDKQIALVQNFAAQAVIAIENARLLNELRQRTDDLTASLDDLRTAQGRLIQTEKLASLGQLTAGIAHEIKNPLNFVNNFSALSAELTDELNDVLKSAKLADDIREEVDDLTGLLKDNLEKVVQHGKRADSIVKNMLLHSREGSGDHRPADINALVDESLNLAYHGARAEKPQFNVTLQRNFDPNAGMIEAFPQEITRVFLNLISNGFYAVTKRKADSGGAGFEPVVSAATKDRGDQVEIRIRDNGTGIPPEVREKMFNPFFTTKPAGEGTGLGLSMSYDIIVKQHGGTIEVDTEPGQFTEFRIVLPRTSNISNKSRG